MAAIVARTTAGAWKHRHTHTHTHTERERERERERETWSCQEQQYPLQAVDKHCWRLTNTGYHLNVPSGDTIVGAWFVGRGWQLLRRTHKKKTRQHVACAMLRLLVLIYIVGLFYVYRSLLRL